VTVTGLRLGAPGVYRAERLPRPAFRPVRLDVTGFVGVAPRGPVDTPVPVESWTDYLWRFGGHEDGPGLLPYAVDAFFAQGGARAYVLRVSPIPRAPDPVAGRARAVHRVSLGSAPGAGRVDVDVAAADEGSWGDGLTVRWDFDVVRRFDSIVDGTDVTLPDGIAPPVGSLLRVRGPVSSVAGSFHWVVELAVRDDGPGVRRRVAVLDRPPAPGGPAHPVDVDVVGTTVTVSDADPAIARLERLTDLGLRRGHPRFVQEVLAAESRLVVPAGTWPDELLPPDESLTSAGSHRVADGLDRWTSIRADSFLDDADPESLPVGGDEGLEDLPPVHGVDRMSLVSEIGLLAVPDLMWSTTAPRAVVDLPAPRRRPVFEPCAPVPPPLAYRTPSPEPVRLDARTELTEVTRRQLHVVTLAERQRRFVALLDVPERLPVRAVARWRASFDSSYAVAYHPWLGVVRPDDPTRRAVLVPPSAFAAGIIADRERRLGIPWGPANELAAGALTAAETLTDAVADELHLLDVDTFRPERDGFRLSSARTLSRSDPDHRQLSVRRLMTLLRLVLERQAQWIVFEPHTEALRRALRGGLVELLRDLFRGGAFAGATEEESFFVHCDESLNPAWSQDLGRLVAEVGVAPSQPLEYLVLRISQDTDGAVGVEG
jgi:uncharacterized protein